MDAQRSDQLPDTSRDEAAQEGPATDVAIGSRGVGQEETGTAIPASPFLPGTSIQYAWDSTSLGYLKTCPRLYQYQMLDGWQPKGENIHLFFGQEFHSAMQEYDIARGAGMGHEDALREVIGGLLTRTWFRQECEGCKGVGESLTHTCTVCDGDGSIGAPWTVDETIRPGKYKNRRTLIGLAISHLDKYNRGQADPAETLVLEDGRPAVELSFRFELDWGPQTTFISDVVMNPDGQYTGPEGKYDAVEAPRQPYILCGHLDRVVTYNDQTFTMDYKTTITTPGDHFFDQFNPSNQMTLYTLAGRVVLDTHIKGVIINADQILLEKPDAHVRGFTYRTQGQLDEWLRDLERWLNQAEAYAQDGYWPMNDTACDKFGGCKFRKICSKDPEVRERFLKADFVQLPEEMRWNPLKPR